MFKDGKDFISYALGLKAGYERKPPVTIHVSLGTCGIAAGGEEVLHSLKMHIVKKNLSASVEVKEVGCMGLCHSEPSVEVVSRKSGSVIYGNVTPEKAGAIIDSLPDDRAAEIDIVPGSWYYPEYEENTGNFIQAKIALRNTGRINPEEIEEYIVNSGYAALLKALTEMTPSSVIDVISASGLRGRGGGGFPTGRKWQFAAAQKSPIKYVICNADEGDPGAFMDRAVLEGDPHSVLEAMAIAGYAIGSEKGYIYIRAEYPLAIKRLQAAIGQAVEKGLLGKNILGTGFSFEIELRYGAGAFVCGEETALINSIEGKRGMPSNKPPYPAIEGLWKKPTIVNNVETFANVCAIIRKGAQWFKGIGTGTSSGTKVFALAGKISKVGLIEVPMGTKLRDIIYDIGGGIINGRRFKAVQTGGPSGGCITADHLDTPIDYETLKALGSMMGSGGMIVMDEDDCMVDIAKFFLDFTVDESCGKCVPCRIGGKQLFNLLVKITEGHGTIEDMKMLKELSLMIKSASLCGLGMTAPNPVLSTMKYFENEYMDHILEKKCRAGKCKALARYEIYPEKCTGCTACARICPAGCISGRAKEKHSIDVSLCVKCGECFRICRFGAVLKK